MKLNYLACAILAAALSSCSESDVKADFGPQVEPEEIQKALDASRITRDPVTEVKLGQFVHYSEVQVLNGMYEAVISDVGMTVIDRQETAETVDLKIIQNKIVYSKEEARKSTTEYNVSLAKPGASAVATVMSAIENAMPIRTFTRKMESQPTSTFTYHNLRVSTELLAAPPAVQKQPNCLGIPECKIRMYNVGYDEIEWETPEKATRITWDFALSPDVPYLAHEMNKCMTFLLPVDAEKPDTSQKVHIKYCLPVMDFRYQCSRAEDPNCPDPAALAP